ncbi:MAG: MAPEG family protein [Pseudomonadota bacterium]|nr:MAPEG family protein [Pseudomonadota bacterium]
MALALAAAILLFSATLAYRPITDINLAKRLLVAAISTTSPAVILFFCIARLARHRYFTAEDIDGSGLTDGSRKARELQAILQNSLEQLALAVPVYLAFGLLAPGFAVSMIPMAAIMFFVGRVLFMIGYSRGAPSRAFGFALTFYPTVILLILTLFRAALAFS